jgi:hypothetical protein
VKEKIEIEVVGKVMGFPYDDENEEQARARLVLEAERHGNDGKARIHLSTSRLKPGSVIKLLRRGIAAMPSMLNKHQAQWVKDAVKFSKEIE